jgi:DNA-binding GntR family transcriptional regulator
MNTVFKQNGKVKRHLLCEHAYRELKSAVVNGWFKADERLVETKLAGIMGISRTPLREAIHKLEREGLVYKLPTGGHAVNSTSEEDIRETRGVAGILLGYAAYLATSKATENDLNLLRRIVRQF